MTYVGLDSCEGCHRQKALEGDQDNLCLDCRQADPFTCASCDFETIHMQDLTRVHTPDGFQDHCKQCLGSEPIREDL